MPVQSKQVAPTFQDKTISTDVSEVLTESKVITKCVDIWESVDADGGLEEIYDDFCSGGDPDLDQYVSYAYLKERLNDAADDPKEIPVLPMTSGQFRKELKKLNNKDDISMLELMFEECISDRFSDVWSEESKIPLDILALALLQVFLREKTQQSN